jgi:hypothetical protein
LALPCFDVEVDGGYMLIALIWLIAMLLIFEDKLACFNVSYITWSMMLI